VPLNVACGPNDQCLDVSAECINGACRCLQDFFDRNGQCGTTSYKLQVKNFGSALSAKRTQVHYYKLSRVK